MSTRGHSAQQKCSYRVWEEPTPVTGKESFWQKCSPLYAFLATNKLWLFSAAEEYLSLGYFSSNSDGQEVRGKKEMLEGKILQGNSEEQLQNEQHMMTN